MPFISKDWRSPGEEWVKTQEGWEKKKVLECTLQRTHGEDNEENSNQVPRVPPHCHITIKCTKEIAGFNGLSEAVRRLDFSSAVRDVRRFNYICALLNLLVGDQRLTHLPGAAQKVLLSMLEEVANQVSRSGQHPRVLRALLAGVRAARDQERAACWGRPLGSRALWGRHDEVLGRATRAALLMRIQGPGPEEEPKFHDLPEECLREIILRLSDYKDLESASAAWSPLAALSSERLVWRALVRGHFTDAQVTHAADGLSLTGPAADTDWQALFHTLRKQHGLREDIQYAETLSLCRHCKCLFWCSLGHPCIADQCPSYRARMLQAGGPLPPHPVPPAAFLQFFSL